MADQVPLPKPPRKSKPPLTPAMVAVDQATGATPPGAGGWTPSPATVIAIGAVGTTCGGLAVALPQAIPGKVGIILGTICGAIAGGCIYFATKSAGPRVQS